MHYGEHLDKPFHTRTVMEEPIYCFLEKETFGHSWYRIITVTILSQWHRLLINLFPITFYALLDYHETQYWIIIYWKNLAKEVFHLKSIYSLCQKKLWLYQEKVRKSNFRVFYCFVTFSIQINETNWLATQVTNLRFLFVHYNSKSLRSTDSDENKNVLMKTKERGDSR